MMKKILAAAIVSAFAAPAFAATANVDIYGQMNVSVDNVDSSNTERRSRVSSNNTHLGFKGAEDLGGGLSAIWQFEYALQLDQQAAGSTFQASSDTQGGNSSRHTFAGLSSKTLGSLTFGTQESPLKTSTGPLAVYTNTLADYRSVFTKMSTRADNSIMYTSPDMSGFVVRAMYGARNEGGTTANDDARMYSLSGVYTNGPLYATLALENNKDSFNAANNSNGTGTIAAHKANAWRAGVGYTFGNTKLGLAYEDNDVTNAAGTAKTNTGHAWYGSVAHKMGNITLNAAYTKRSDTLSTTNNSADQVTAGVDYNLSKRTMVYALYTKVDNDGTGTNGLGPATGIATVTTSAGGEASGFSLGMSHKF